MSTIQKRNLQYRDGGVERTGVLGGGVVAEDSAADEEAEDMTSRSGKCEGWPIVIDG